MRIKIFLRMMLLMPACFSLSKTIAQTSTIEKPLTNNDVVSMVNSGISSGIIKATIEKSKTNFDLSPASVIELKKSRTPDDVVLSMIIKSRTIAAVAPKDTLSLMPQGIYNRSDKGYRLLESHQLRRSISKGAAGMLKKAIGSLINGTTKTEITGAHAALIIDDTKPVFIFILDFPARNPEEFFLVRLSQTPNTRQIIFQKTSNIPGIIDVNDTLRVACSNRKLQDGIYEVSPIHPLQAGEYCFIYNASERYKGNSFTVFDFAIDHPSNGNQ